MPLTVVASAEEIVEIEKMQKALALTQQEPERQFLRERIRQLK